jgi:hypothetical protein
MSHIESRLGAIEQQLVHLTSLTRNNQV